MTDGSNGKLAMFVQLTIEPPSPYLILPTVLIHLKKIIMETTIKINTDSIPPDFVDAIKKLFPHKVVEINIQPADATDFILSNPEYTRVLMERIENYNTKKQVISLNADDLI
jgi:hypothetical protein